MSNYVKCNALERLLRNKKTPALFIGAGFSKRYLKGYVTWMELLNRLAERIGIDTFTLDTQYKTFLAEEHDEGIAKQRLGGYLEKQLKAKILDGKYATIFSASDINTIQTKQYEPFKYLVTELIPKKLTLIDDPELTYLSTELNLFKQLKDIVPCVITTNYDCLLESLFNNNFTTYIRQSDYFNNSDYINAEIYKIHGCITQPNSLIVSDEDYEQTMQKAHLTSAKLLEVLCCHPIIFIGYSLSDSDVNAVIQNLLSCLQPYQVDELQKNIIFIQWKKSVKSMYENEKEFPNHFKVTYITTDNYTKLFQYINGFKPTATPLELRKFYHSIRDLIATNDEKLKTVVASLSDLHNLPEEVAVTDITTSNKGYKKYKPTDLVLDVLNEADLNSFDVLNEWFMQNIAYNTNAPLYYYIKHCKVLDKLSAEAKEKIQKFLQRKNKELPKETELYRTNTSLERALSKCDKEAKKIPILIYNYVNGTIEKEKYKNYLKSMYQKNAKIVEMNEFKKAVFYLDWDQKTKI